MDIATIIVTKLITKSLDKLFQYSPKLISKIWSFGTSKQLSVVESLSSKSPYYVFVYGSNLYPENLNRTIEVNHEKLEYLPVSLSGFKFEWNSPHKKQNLVIKNSDKFISFPSSEQWVSLVIRETGNPIDKVEGALISVTHKMMQQLIYREKNYTLKHDIISFLRPVKGSLIPSKSQISTFIYEGETLNPAQTYYLRKEYYIQILAARKELGYTSFITPLTNIRLSDVHYCDYELKNIWKKLSNKRLDQYSKSFENVLYNSNVLRRVGRENTIIPSSLRPFFLDKYTYEKIARLAELSVIINHKIYKTVLDNDELFKQAGFSSKDKHLASNKLLNNIGIPKITRVDLVLRGDSIKIFEINSDSPGGMFHYDVLLKEHLTYCSDKGIDIGLSLKFSLSDTICSTLLDSWETFCLKKECDKLAISNIIILECHPEQQPTFTEFCHFRDLIRVYSKKRYNKTINVDIVSPEELEYKNGFLWYKRNKKVDLIYKRALWKELGMNKSDDLYNAYLDNNVCIVNSLSSRNIGNKYLTALLHSERFRAKYFYNNLSNEEIEQVKEITEYFPTTYCWSDKGPIKITDNQKNNIFKAPYKFVFKSFQGYGSKEVYIGHKLDHPREILNEIIKSENYIAQKSVPHGLADFPVIDGASKVQWIHSNFIIGAYVINGKCVAMEAKIGEIPISMNLEGRYRTTVLPVI